jgi:hypothetical protein
MSCEDQTLALYFSGICGIWGIFGLLWVLSILRRCNLLSVVMAVMLFFKFINSLSLAGHFFTCGNDEVYWGLIAVATYPLYNSLLLGVMVMLSKGYCIVFEDISDTSVLSIAATLGCTYLVYSVSLIDSSMLGMLVISYLSLICYGIIRSINKILHFLLQKVNLMIQMRRNSYIINKRIQRYKIFKKSIFFYFISQTFAISICFCFSVGNYSYNMYSWYIFESLLEFSRILLFFVICLSFNPYFQMNRNFFLILSFEVPEIFILQNNGTTEPRIDIPCIYISPDYFEILLASPIPL